jgi:hypothetical protein
MRCRPAAGRQLRAHAKRHAHRTQRAHPKRPTHAQRQSDVRASCGRSSHGGPGNAEAAPGAATTDDRAPGEATSDDPGAAPAAFLPLHQRGTQIVNSAGQPVSLRGVDLGGWLDWEGWIWGGGYDSETQIMTGLATLVGQPAAEHFQAAVENSFISEADIRAIAALGFNVIRVPFNYRILENPLDPFVWKGSGWQLLDNVIHWARKYGVYVVLDMHAAPGGQADAFPYDPTWPLLWGSVEYQNQMVAMWQAIAARYSTDSAVAGYDLLGEPWPTPNEEALVNLYARAIAAIRSVDTTHMIFLEGARDSRDFSWAKTPLDSNMVYSPHMYLWSRGSVQQAQEDLDGYAQLAKAQNVPLWIGEFGENFASQDALQASMFAAQPTVAGWAFWTWKLGPGLADLDEIRLTPAWNAIMKWIENESNPKPSAAEATLGMQQFLTAIQYSHDVLNQQLAQALLAPTG